MNQIVAVRMYQLDESQNTAIEALAREQQKEPDDIVREAVAKYIVTAVKSVDDEMEYRKRFAEIMANPQHPARNNPAFGSWTGVDGVEFQNALRGK